MDEGFKLYAAPSFIEGVARLMDFGGALNEYNTASSPELADEKAIRSDWVAVGKDIDSAINNFAEKNMELP